MKSRQNLKGLSFMVRIYGNQNSTWQGSLHIADNQEAIPFRSALELIRLMDEAVELNAESAVCDGEE